MSGQSVSPSLPLWYLQYRGGFYCAQGYLVYHILIALKLLCGDLCKTRIVNKFFV